MPVPLYAVRQGAVVNSNEGAGATVGRQVDIGQYIYKEGERSANKATIWQQKAYDDQLVRRVQHQWWDGRTSPKVVINRDDTTVASGSRIEEIGSAFRLRARQGKGKETQDKTESVMSFTTSGLDLSPHTEVQMKLMMRELSDLNQLAERVLDLSGCPDDTWDADGEDSQSTIIFRTSRGLVREIKEEQWSSTSRPPVLRVSR